MRRQKGKWSHSSPIPRREMTHRHFFTLKTMMSLEEPFERFFYGSTSKRPPRNGMPVSLALRDWISVHLYQAFVKSHRLCLSSYHATMISDHDYIFESWWGWNKCPFLDTTFGTDKSIKVTMQETNASLPYARRKTFNFQLKGDENKR